MLDTIKGRMKNMFVLNDHANKSFELLKEKIATEPILVLQDLRSFSLLSVMLAM